MESTDSTYWHPKGDKVLQAVCELAHATIGKPVAVWIWDSKGNAIVPHSQAGLAPEDFANAIATVGDGSILAEIVAGGQEKAVRNISTDRVLRRCQSFGMGEQVGMFAVPAKWRSETLGVVGIFSTQTDRITQPDRENLARTSTVVGEHAGRVRRAQLLARATQAVAQSPDLNVAMRIIAETAQELTGCDASMLWLLDSQTNLFVLGGRSALEDWPSSKPRTSGGLTRHILDHGQSIWIDDSSRDERVREELVSGGMRSLVGVPVRREEKATGVLFVYSLERARFNADDVYILEALAAQVSAGLCWAQRLFAPMDNVERSIARLYTVEETLSELCEHIKVQMGFDYVEVSLTEPEGRTIETVFTTGATEWTGIAKHPMDTAPKLRDIAVDVVRSHPRRIEVIHGFDSRFDRWIYEHGNHGDYVRAWVPILLVRDESGQFVPDWLQHAHWDVGPEEQLPNGGWRYALTLRDTEERYPLVSALGTVDAGYRDPNRYISPEQARQLAAMVNARAHEIHDTQLSSLLETVADAVRRVLRADAASFHFAFNPERQRFVYEVAAGENSLRFFYRNNPGHHELGREAIEQERPRFIPDQSRGEADDAVNRLAPNLYRKAVRAIAAFPLVVSGRESVLYVYFNTVHRFTEDEIRWGETFARGARNAISDATRVLHSRDKTRQLANIHNIVRSLVTNPEPEKLLADIAGYSANILGADVVTIYAYRQLDGRFFYPPARAGRLMYSEAVEATIPEEASRVIEEGVVLYAEGCAEETEGGGKDEHRFAVREQIRSCIVCPLRERDETVGVMFVNYRAPRRFNLDDKEFLVPTLAAAAAMTIRATRTNDQLKQDLNRRKKELDALRLVDEAIATGMPDLPQVLDLILQVAMELTSAEAGYVFQYDPWHVDLGLVAERGLPPDTRSTRQSLDQGIVGMAARLKVPVLAADVLDPVWRDTYMKIIPETRSELAIPLLDKEVVWGVLNVEHPTPGKFNEDDCNLLETFAVQAMIAVHSVNLYAQLQRQIQPLRSLGVIYSRIQDPQHDINTVLRLLLTGVTAGTGLSFSRAMLFLSDEKEHQVRGVMAIGAKTHHEATTIWKELQDIEEQLNTKDQDSLSWFLDEAERISANLREGIRDDCPLSEGVKQQRFTTEGLGGAFSRCITERRSIIVKDEEPDPFREILQKISGSDDEQRPFACVPLVGRIRTEGVLVVDYRFKMHEREIDDKDRISLDAYAGVAAMAIENDRAQENFAEQQRLETWRHFARQAAHSIGNRIALTEGSVYRLQDALAKSGDHKGLIDRLQESLDSAKELLTRFRELLNPAEPKFELLDLKELLEIVERQNRDRLGTVPLQIDSPEPFIAFWGDRLLITDAFAELIKNALEAMASERIAIPWIAIRVCREENGATLRIEIANPGEGIPEEKKRHLFEPFLSTKGRGRGLGLATIKHSVEGHGGTIEENGIPGEYACFVIRLPLLKDIGSKCGR